MSRSATRNQKAKLAADYNDLLRELSSQKMTSVGCYSIGDTIGEGSYGKVKLAVHKFTGHRVAVKKISKQHAPMMAREIHHHRQLRHPNIVALYEVIASESSIHVVSEYCPNGELFDALADAGRFTEQRAQRLFVQLVDAIRHCHAHGIIHRDLKLENILLDADYNAKICDFGFARHAENRQLLNTFCGSLAYSAPEVIMRKKYTGPETDVWSLGVILYTLLAGELPFDDDSEIVMQRKITVLDYEMPSYFSPEANALISQILKLNPNERLTIDQVANHPWLLMSFDDEDEDYDSMSSTRNSSHSDIDSIFSAPRIAGEDEDEVSTEFSGHDSFTSLADTKMPPVRTFPQESAKFSPQVRYSLGIMRPDDKNRFTPPQSPRFSAPTVSSRLATSPPASPYRSSLPSMLPSTAKSPDDALMTAAEQRLASALLTAGFDEEIVRNMRNNVCDTSNTLWHMLLDKLGKDGSSKRAADPFGVARPPIPRLPTKTAHEPSVAILSGVDHETQTDLPATRPDPVQPQPQPLLPPPPPIAPLTELPLPPKPSPPAPLLRAAPPARPLPFPLQHPGDAPRTPVTTATRSPVRSEKTGWFTSVKSWFAKQDDMSPHDAPAAHLPAATPTGISMAMPPRPSQVRPPSYRDFDMTKKLAEEDMGDITQTPPIYRSSSLKYRRRVLQLQTPPVSEVDQLSYSATTAPPRAAISPPPPTAGLIMEKRPPHWLTHPTSPTNTNAHRSSMYYSPIHSPVALVAPPPTAALTSPRVADTLSIVTAPLHAPSSAMPANEATEIDICEKRYSMYRLVQQPSPPPSPPITRPTQAIDIENRIPATLACLPIEPLLTPDTDEEAEPCSSKSSLTLSETESEDAEEAEDEPSRPSFPSPSPIPSLKQSSSPSFSTTPPPAFASKTPPLRRFEFTPRPRLSVYGMNDRGQMGGRAIIEEEEEEDE